MGFRRRRTFRRRGGSLRWFTPNLWNGALPALYASETVTTPGGTGEIVTAPAVTHVLRGSSPFPGMNNSAGILSGKMLAERQYWQALRVVGRMNWYFTADDEIDMNSGGIITVWWGLVRSHTNENGVPDTPLLALEDEENQDEKPLILAQDVWRTSYPAGTLLQPGTLHPLAGEPPLYSMVDKTLKRGFRNEQDMFLTCQLGVTTWGNATGIPFDTELHLHGAHSLRLLGRFGR